MKKMFYCTPQRREDAKNFGKIETLPLYIPKNLLNLSLYLTLQRTCEDGCEFGAVCLPGQAGLYF